MRLTVTTLVLLICTVIATYEKDVEAEELLKYLFKNMKNFPRINAIPKSEKYPEVGLTGVT